MQVKYKEPLLLFHQERGCKLHDVSDDAGPAFQKDCRGARAWPWATTTTTARWT